MYGVQDLDGSSAVCLAWSGQLTIAQASASSVLQPQSLATMSMTTVQTTPSGYEDPDEREMHCQGWSICDYL